MGITCSSCMQKRTSYSLPLTSNKSISPTWLQTKKKFKTATVNDYALNKSTKEAISAIVTTRKKTPEDQRLILGALSSHLIFDSLDRETQLRILDSVCYYEIEAKETVFKKGDPGVNFFCVAVGRLEAQCDNEKTLIGPGVGFGELALIDDRPRTSTIKTIDQCGLWGISRKAFNSSIKKLKQLSYSQNKKFLNSIPLLDPLMPDQKEMILAVLLLQNFSNGQTIINEGEKGDLFYILKEGTVACYENKIEKRQLNVGQYFGEQALLYNTLRTATVIAQTDVKVLSIDRVTLMNVIGGKFECILYNNSQLMCIDKSEILRSLSATQVEILLKCSKIFRYYKGEVLIYQGNSKCEKLFLVLKGCIRGPQIDFGSHSCIGDKEFYTADHSKYEANYTALEDTDVAEINLLEFESEIGSKVSEIALENEFKLLTKVQIFTSLSYEKIRLLALIGKTVEFKPNECIIQEKALNDHFYIVKSGLIKVYNNGKFIRDILKYDYFGERAIIFNESRSATVIASGSVICWMFHKQDFLSLITETIRSQLNQRIRLQDSIILLEQLRPIKVIGTGMFGNVILVTHSSNKTLYALKSVSRNKIQSFDIYENLLFERRILLQLDHSMIIKVIRTFKDWARVYYLLEYVKGQDLFDVLIQIQTVKEDCAKFYAACLILTLEYLHDRKIAHRDLKPENIMIDEDGYTKLIDFGTAKIIEGRTYTTVGTPHYMAPEVILRNGYGCTCDLWSLGVMIYEIIFGKVPFGNDDDDPKVIYEKIVENQLDLKRSPYHGNGYKEFIKQLLSVNPIARLGGEIEGLRSHTWFKNFNWKRLAARMVKPPFLPTTNKSFVEEKLSEVDLKEMISELESMQEGPSRKMSVIDPDEWDSEF